MGFQNLTGTILGQYELRELLGAGGMGAVYRSYQANLKRYVAVKVISGELAQQPGYLERFTREAETSAALEHPNIITIHDYGMQQGSSYLVMQLLTGGTLAERIAQRADTDNPLPSLGEIVDLLKQLSSALDYAHSQGVVHRDIKPSNVMFDSHGQAYLVDFGIAKIAQETQALTASGMVVGTWGYMAPEQWRNEDLTAATDQYALGIMTYALVTGQMPFEAQTPAGVMHKHLNEKPAPPRAFRPDVPDALTHVIERVLAKVPDDRFPTCTAFAQAFDGAIRGNTGPKTAFFTAPLQRKPAATSRICTPSGTPAAGPATAERPIYRHPVLWLALVVIVVLAGALLLTMLDGGSDDPSETPDAAHISETSTASETTESAIVLVPSATPEPTATDALIETPPPTATETSPPTDTSTPTPTLEIALVVGTLDAQATVDQATAHAQASAAVRATAYAVSTQDAQNQTATAASWTDTPTPDMTASIDAYRTQQAATETQAWIDSWTNTPTPTATHTPTPTNTHTPTPTATNTPLPTATPDPLQAALERAQNFSGDNDDWEPFVQDFDGVEMVLVPAGCFEMGSTAYDNEQPIHTVCFEEPFWIDRYEVTNGQFAAFGGVAAEDGRWTESDRPRERITWYEASDYCESRGARLLTEAEWEYAARGPNALAYPWGDEWDQSLVIGYRDLSEGTAAVGSIPAGASWVGALDMSGNVWEWMADWYDADYYGRLAEGVVNPQGPETGDYRVLQGGSWISDDTEWFRAAYRSHWNPGLRNFGLGFRCARSRGS